MPAAKLFAGENSFDREFLAASQATGVPVSVLKGFAAVESAFNPDAQRAEPRINDASYGLLQILYKTAQAVGYKGQPRGLLDPKTNLLYGAKYLRDRLERHADIRDAIAAYNMGTPRRAEATTATIIGIYGEPKPGWTYANQPYVDRVAAYIAYFQTFEKPAPKTRALLMDAVKKKILSHLADTFRNPLCLSRGDRILSTPS